MASFPDYYNVLNISKDASTEDIRQAYRKESLKLVIIRVMAGVLTDPCSRTHPDRHIHATTEERKAATEKFQVRDPFLRVQVHVCRHLNIFQAVADAYYVLSDPQRRREYDKLAASKSSSERTTDPNASSTFFNTFANMFSSSSSGTSGTGSTPANQSGQRPNPDHVFGDVFEDVCVPSHVTQPARRQAHYLH